MASVNRVILIGNLGAKPDLKYLPSGQAVCEMRIATNEKWKDKQGELVEKTEWHRIVVWGKMGENCAQYLDKGRPIYVEGRIQTRKWQDKETGADRYMTEIVANTVQFLGDGRGGKRDEDAPSNGGSTEGGFEPPAGSGSSGPPPADDGDIPF